MTSVVAVMRRSYTVGMFDDLTGGLVCTRTLDKATGITTLDFDGDLTNEQVDAVWARMESKDDADQAQRAALRALVVEHPDCALSVALTNYVLGGSP